MKYKNYVCIPTPFCGNNKIKCRIIYLLILMVIWDSRVYNKLKISLQKH